MTTEFRSENGLETKPYTCISWMEMDGKTQIMVNQLVYQTSDFVEGKWYLTKTPKSEIRFMFKDGSIHGSPAVSLYGDKMICTESREEFENMCWK